MPEPSDPDFDALKRKARRRLVGAVILALAAAVFVPMLLESEQKPLGDDVSVKIPPVDDGKFVNQLNAPAGTAAPGAAGTRPAPATVPAPAPAPAPPDSSAGAAPRTSDAAESHAIPTQPADAGSGANPTASPPPPADSPAAVAPVATAKSPDSAAAKPTAKSLSDAEHRVLGAGTPAKATVAAPAKAAATPAVATKVAAPKVPDASAKPAASATSSVSYVVQLAAFSDDKGANSLSNRLKKAGYASYTEPVTTSHGTLWRVRVGPFASREDANTARDRLKHDGYSGLVAANPRTT